MAADVLGALVGAGHEICVVVTAADARRGRREPPVASPVRRRALELGLPTTAEVSDVVAAGADLGVVVAFGALVPGDVLAVVPMVNLHFSLLPRWRGAAPVERAILAGDAETGVCLMAVDTGLDTGPVHARAVVPIGAEESADELRDRLGTIGTDLLLRALAAMPDSLAHPETQSGEVTYAAKLGPEERRLEWSRPAVELHRVVRVGRAWTTFRGRRLLVHRARLADPIAGRPPPGTLLEGGRVVTGAGALDLVDVQLEGRAVQPVAAFLRGARPRPGECLGP